MDPFDLRLWSEFLSTDGKPCVIDQICIDSRRIHSSKALFVALKGDQHDGHDFVRQAMLSGAKYAIVSRHWTPPADLSGIQLIAVDSPLKAFQSLVKAYCATKKAKIVAIAGTYGKTMIKDLLNAILSTVYQVAASPESFNSQIGVPLSLLTIQNHHDIALIELSISEKGEMEALASMTQPHHVIITPIGKKHLATLKDTITIENETLKLLKHVRKEGWKLLPKALQNSTTQNLCWDANCSELPHAELAGEQSNAAQTYCLKFPDGASYEGNITSGFYYFLNLVNIAAKAAWLLELPSKVIAPIILTYTPQPMRTEIWKSQQGATFINDSYCEDPQSVDQALKLYQQCPGSRRLFIFGGFRKKKSDVSTEICYKRIGDAIARNEIDQLILIDQLTTSPLTKEVTQQSPSTKLIHFKTYDEALQHLKLSLKPMDLVLLKGENKFPLNSLMEACNDSVNANQCTINLDAVKTNIARLRSKLPDNTRLMIMVKAFAYGTGELQLAKFLGHCGIDILGVSNVDEAVALKSAGVSQTIFILHAAPYEASKVAKWGFEVGISDKTMINSLNLEAQKQQINIKIHLHINTGMGRFGCRPEEALELALAITQNPALSLEGIMTHFASADDPEEDSFTLHQSKTFDQAIETLSKHGIMIPWKHAANSSAALRFEFSQYNMVRIGLALYGFGPFSTIELRQALSLTSRIVGVNRCMAGETVSYGRSYKVLENEERIAILPLGYFDGLHRIYSNKGFVLIRGIKAPIVGKICMDYMMVDITHIPSASIGDQVLIFGVDDYGHSLPPHEFASTGNSIVHELITCLGPRIPRIFVHEEKE